MWFIAWEPPLSFIAGKCTWCFLRSRPRMRYAFLTPHIIYFIYPLFRYRIKYQKGIPRNSERERKKGCLLLWLLYFSPTNAAKKGGWRYEVFCDVRLNIKEYAFAGGMGHGLGLVCSLYCSLNRDSYSVFRTTFFFFFLKYSKRNIAEFIVDVCWNSRKLFFSCILYKNE